VPVGLILLGIVILLLGHRVLSRQSAAARQKLARIAVGLGGVLLLLLLLRFGMPWLALVGGAMWALLRFVAPVALRLLPLLLARWENPAQASANPSAAKATGRRGTSNMTYAEALDVLGLAEGATKEEILQAYRQLIKKVHPDRGGSAHLASEVNRARDVLLSTTDESRPAE
jgi:DnaJ homolog subfamily C member 19